MSVLQTQLICLVFLSWGAPAAPAAPAPSLAIRLNSAPQLHYVYFSPLISTVQTV